MFGKKKQATKGDQYSKYVDPTGELPNRELEAAEWYITHKELMQKIGTGMLIVFCVVTMGYSLYYWFEYAIMGYAEDERLLAAQRRSFSDVPKKSSSAENVLLIDDVRVFQSASGRYDVFAKAHNRSPVMLATISFHFTFLGGETPTKQVILLPGSRGALAEYGFPIVSEPSAATLVIDRVSWRRVNPHTVPNAIEFMTVRLQFEVDRLVFLPAHSDGGVPANQVSFDVTNKSAYSYWQTAFAVEFLDGDEVTGVAPLSIDSFKAGEKRHVAFGILNPAVRAQSVRLLPIINVFDRGVFIPPGAL